ncbi:YtxH domain-containing protein [Arthrobacter echini]|uniref:YtxH domain-containing protein n=1 Tax=Arthrobacter echini TaxID=1529066 RepID=A0A4S5EAC6_9MICC|nr:YtxH domain-containing protein [Arthrobacter echini]THJ68562.1 YtxH domain-containing protein [Arthrobacter echini]
MKNKLVFSAGMAVGYVLGARAGRDSYEQLKSKAQELWGNPKVQDTVSNTAETIKDKAPEVQDALKDALPTSGSGGKDAGKDSQQSAERSGADGTTSSTTSTTGGTDGGTDGTSGGSGRTGPSGGDPWELEDQPFQAQDEDTRPELGKDFGK